MKVSEMEPADAGITTEDIIYVVKNGTSKKMDGDVLNRGMATSVWEFVEGTYNDENKNLTIEISVE